MSDNNINKSDTPIFDALSNSNNEDEQSKNKVVKSWIPTVRKAFTGAVTGAATALIGTLPPMLSDGVFTVPEFWFAFTVTVGAGIIGFATVWKVPNESVQ